MSIHGVLNESDSIEIPKPNFIEKAGRVLVNLIVKVFQAIESFFSHLFSSVQTPIQIIPRENIIAARWGRIIENLFHSFDRFNTESPMRLKYDDSYYVNFQGLGIHMETLAHCRTSPKLKLLLKMELSQEQTCQFYEKHQKDLGNKKPDSMFVSCYIDEAPLTDKHMQTCTIELSNGDYCPKIGLFKYENCFETIDKGSVRLGEIYPAYSLSSHFSIDTSQNCNSFVIATSNDKHGLQYNYCFILRHRGDTQVKHAIEKMKRSVNLRQIARSIPVTCKTMYQLFANYVPLLEHSFSYEEIKLKPVSRALHMRPLLDLSLNAIEIEKFKWFYQNYLPRDCQIDGVDFLIHTFDQEENSACSQIQLERVKVPSPGEKIGLFLAEGMTTQDFERNQWQATGETTFTLEFTREPRIKMYLFLIKNGPYCKAFCNFFIPSSLKVKGKALTCLTHQELIRRLIAMEDHAKNDEVLRDLSDLLDGFVSLRFNPDQLEEAKETKQAFKDVLRLVRI